MVKQYQRRKFVLEAGEPNEEAIFVHSGILALVRPDSTHRGIVAVRFPGEAIPPKRHPGLAIETIVDAEIETIPGPRFFSRHNGIDHARKNEAIAHEWTARNGMHDATGRIAHLLCETDIRGSYGGEFARFPFSQIEIAEMTGQTSVNVNRAMAELTREGLISRRPPRGLSFPDIGAIYRRAGFRPEHYRA